MTEIPEKMLSRAKIEDTKSDHVCLVCRIEGKHNLLGYFLSNQILLNAYNIYYRISKHNRFSFVIAPECGKNTLHYGGICCYSCRAFFRRAHQHTKNPNFICRAGYKDFLPLPVIQNEGFSANSVNSQGLERRQCGTDVQTRRQCQYHRLKRCLEIGRLYECICSYQ